VVALCTIFNLICMFKLNLNFGRKFLLPLFILLIFVVMALTGCGKAPQEHATHASGTGLMAELFVPGDAGMMMVYSLRDDAQFTAMKSLDETLAARIGPADESATGAADDGRIMDMVADSFESQFGELGLTYEEDLLPALGEQFRVVFASRPGSTEDEVEAFTVVTLENPEAMEVLFEALVDAEQMEFKNLSSVDAYVDEGGDSYSAIVDDVLLVSNQPEALVEMATQDEEDSLWGAEEYQDLLESFGGNYLFYTLVYPAIFDGDASLSTAGLAAAGLDEYSLDSLQTVTESQVMVVRAEADGFDFDVYVAADEEAAKAAGVTLDALPKEEPYLHEEMPIGSLMAYFEFYGLKDAVEYWQELAEASEEGTPTLDWISSFVRSYFAMDFEDEVLAFLDKGYSVALHQNGDGVVPGITIYADVSSDVDAAEEFMTQLDLQVSGLMLVLDAALPGAVTKSAAEIGGVSFDLLEIDLTEISRDGESPLPAVVTSSEIQLAYGVLDDRLLITTAAVWEDEYEVIADSSFYSTLSDKLDEASEGLYLIDAQNLAGFMGVLRSLREQLDLGVSDDSTDFESLLEGFAGGIAASEASEYEMHFSGFLMIAD
jgi:hypothetical protein